MLVSIGMVIKGGDKVVYRYSSMVSVLLLEFLMYQVNKRYKYTLAYLTPFLPFVNLTLRISLDVLTVGETKNETDLRYMAMTMVRANDTFGFFCLFQGVLNAFTFKTFLLLNLPIFVISLYLIEIYSEKSLQGKFAHLDIEQDEIMGDFVKEYTFMNKLGLVAMKVLLFWLLFDSDLDMFFRVQNQK